MIKVKNTFYVDKEIQHIIIEYYLIKRNLISFLEGTISFTFVGARTFDRARTFTRTFDRGFVRGEYNDLKFCRRIFYYAAAKSGMCMSFLLVERKNESFFNVIIPVCHH